MNDEERQHTMDFILQQQAQLTAAAQRNEEEHAKFNESLKQLRGIAVAMARQFRRERTDLRERIGALVDAQVKSEDKVSRAEDIMKRLEESHARSDERMTRVEESQARSEERLTRLEELTGRNSEDIAALAKVVADMARGRNGDTGAA